MGNRFIDGANGADTTTSNGNTTDTSYATIEYFLESGSVTSGDIGWWRRGANEIPTSDIAPIYDGAANSPIRIIGAPRNDATITSSTWTNGSKTVDLVVGVTLARTSHQSRYITAPDGEIYFISQIVDSNTFILLTEYVGSTVSGGGGASTINKDEDYDTFIAIDDTAWTIKIDGGWSADADAISNIDFNDANFQLNISGDGYLKFKNIEFKDSTDSEGIIKLSSSTTPGNFAVSFINCLFKQSTQSDRIIDQRADFLYLQACTLEGSGSGGGQRGIYQAGVTHLRDVAIYNMGDNGIICWGTIFYEGLNIGVETANGDNDIQMHGCMYGRDLQLGGSNGLVLFASAGLSEIACENYQNVLGDHRTFFPGGYYERSDITGETPNKKVSDFTLKITPNVNNFEFIEDWAVPMLVHEIEATTDAKAYKYWIYNDSGVTLNDVTAKDDIWLKVEYIKTYDDTSEYTFTEEFSTEIDILDAASADDWDFLQITGVTPAIASKVRLTIYFSKYLAATNVFIDPAVVVS